MAMFARFLLLSTALAFAKAGEILVDIEGGKINGTVLTDYKGGSFLAFMAIPYAKPPLGALRFKPLEPTEPWEGVRDGTDDMPQCIQSPFEMTTGQEDCLYMNVYTKNVKPNQLKPVMVYIHEGAFTLGTGSSDNHGAQHLLVEDIVLVTFNYRLGALGFLHLEGSDINANNGLKDQVFALQWVQRNVHHFGGDNSSVTIFGESAGAASVSLHLLSPMSKGLFHKAISQSGVATAPWIIGAKNTGLELAKALGIKAVDPMIIADELRKVPCDELFEAQLEIKWYGRADVLWNGGPVIEGKGDNKFLPDDPFKMLEDFWGSTMPYILGINNLEGHLSLFLTVLFGQPYNFSIAAEIPYALTKADTNVIREVSEEVKKYYFNDEVSTEFDEVLVGMLSDILFKYPIIQYIRHTSHLQTIYLYMFAADTSLNYCKRFTPEFKLKGAVHVDDLGYIFQSEFNPDITLGSIEDKTVEKMVKLWTNFAKYGKPVPDAPSEDLDNVVWKPALANEMNCLYIDHVALNDSILGTETAAFWDTLYQKYNRIY